MASVAENLKKLRTVKGLTQEDVASQIGLTRQAISSYESGRTQPPLDLLTRFAEIYGVEIEDVLYGYGRDVRGERAMNILAWVTAGVWLGGFLLCGVLSVACQTMISPREMPDTYFSLLTWVERLQTVGLFVLSVGCVLLLVLDVGGNFGGTARRKALYWARMVLLILALTFLWAAADPVYVLADLLVYAFDTIVLTSVTLGIDLAACRIRKQRKRLYE